MSTSSLFASTLEASSSSEGQRLQSRKLPLAVGAALAVAVLQAVLVLLFAWPASRSAPHDLPLAVAGSGPAAAAFERGLDRARPGAFTFSTVGADAAARAAIAHRNVYGAVVLNSGRETPSISVLIATNASPAVAQLLSGAIPAAARAANPATQVTVTDVSPPPSDDPRGNAPATSLIPIVITSIVAGVLLTLLASSLLHRLLGAVGMAVLAGQLATLVLQQWLGTLGGSYWSVSGVISLLVLAVTATTLGLGALAKYGGIAIAAVLVFVLGYPFSGANGAPELLPTPWGSIGSWLPAGAGIRALRSTAFFDNAAAGGPVWALAGWAAAGLALLVVAVLVPGSASRSAHRS